MKHQNSQSSEVYHFIGIGGSGMAPLAAIAKKRGHEVTGSDAIDSPNITKLKELGIKISLRQLQENVPPLAIVVISSAIADQNPEIVIAKTRSQQIIHRSDLLAKFGNQNNFITIAGTHGKTTSSAMITYLFFKLNTFPTAVIGGNMKMTASSWLVGETDLCIAEADESDGTFLKYQPEIAVVTNIDTDHLDFYKQQSSIYAAFLEHLNNISDSGTAVIGIDSPEARKLSDQYQGNKITFGLCPESDLYACNINQSGNGISYDLKYKGKLYKVKMRSLGKHNVLNSLSALATCTAYGLNIERAIALLPEFPGVSRRMDVLLDDQQIKIIDDYAHNPGKIEACIRAVRSAWPEWRLFVIFEPHKYSRISSQYEQFLTSFKNCDHVHICPIYETSKTENKSIDVEKFASDICCKSSVNTTTFTDINTFLNSIDHTKAEKTAILCLGAGRSNKIALECKEQILNDKKI